MSLYRRFKDRFGTAGVVLGVIAIVLAIGGSALAKGLFTKPQEKQIAKIAKKEAQKYANSNPGAPGTAGTNGTNGTNGAKGDTGEKGAKGDQGIQGIQGIQGPKGDPGEPGVLHPGETLPSEATETGTFGITPLAKASGFFGLHIPISFPIPLAAPIEDAPECGEAGNPDCVIHIFEGETIPSGCTGTENEVLETVEDLGAEPGNFCVDLFNHGNLVAAQLHPLNPEVGGFSVSPRGANLSATAVEGAFALGTWAVTAE